MTRNLLFLATLVAVFLSPINAYAGVWFEVLHAPCWTGDEDNVKRPAGQEILYGRYRGAVDCFNDDFNGGGARTVLSIKAFQAWEYGTMFLYYDITGPWNGANSQTDGEQDSANERGGFFGGITTTVSAKKLGEKFAGRELDWGPIADLELKYEMEHVAKFGMLNYYGLQWSLKQPFFDFVSVTTVIRDDSVFKGIDFQLGAAWQKSFSLGSQDFIFGGFFSAGLFGEGEGVGNFEGQEGNQFFLAQPQLLWDFGKPIGFTPGKLYAGFEYQLAFNRYLIGGKTENVLQGMLRWNI
ncbi:hypothetical protein [Hyalangium sp.]|uniref:hypothetical protein n=1 Tax=Hyalangium sp. TaxID=2028555 RepID=UPI002D290819|nr:hypothetical protein [Hyalangium sp.]HYH96257.1 hypothetical protein [Hyalangium sp.]